MANVSSDRFPASAYPTDESIVIPLSAIVQPVAEGDPLFQREMQMENYSPASEINPAFGLTSDGQTSATFLVKSDTLAGSADRRDFGLTVSITELRKSVNRLRDGPWDLLRCIPFAHPIQRPHDQELPGLRERLAATER